MRRTLRPQVISQLRVDDHKILGKILAHLRDKDPTFYTQPLLIAPSRAPPETLPLSRRRARGIRFQSNYTQPSRQPLETVWHELPRAITQD